MKPIRAADDTPFVVELLSSCPQWKFYLTGSRFFKRARLDSDWDFFVQRSDLVEAYLLKLGFLPVSGRECGYTDRNTITVYRKKLEDAHPYLSIDVQLVKDAKKKNKVQNKFLAEGRIDVSCYEWDRALIPWYLQKLEKLMQYLSSSFFWWRLHHPLFQTQADRDFLKKFPLRKKV